MTQQTKTSRKVGIEHHSRVLVLLGVVLLLASSAGCGRHETLLAKQHIEEGLFGAETDFKSRCNGPGVIRCNGFDSLAETSAVYPGSKTTAALDTVIKASGNSSLKFTIPGNSGANAAGAWDTSLSAAGYGEQFGENSTFYVQFRQRFSPEMFNKMGKKGWKTAIFAHQSKSCANMEITTTNGSWHGFPQMYTRCGAEGFRLKKGSDFILQWTSDYPNTKPGDIECHYQDPNTKDCHFFQSNQWMTFYYEVHIGNWGQPNSYVKAWVANEDQPLRQFIHYDSWRARQNPDG